MVSINTAKRLLKRVILANFVSEKENLFLTPLVSGKHGIGKSAMIKSIANDIGGVCITIEGGTLKEGEITGIPYQYKDETGKTKFRFLPYYAVERIQSEEKRLYDLLKKCEEEKSALYGDENQYSLNNMTAKEKLELIKNHTVQPVIIFIDEINRTENTVYKELMNILLTRTVNGYEFPWWVVFVGAMNPSTQSSIYATNEMDPAQLDRFIKIKVGENVKEWLEHGKSKGISPQILSFINLNPECLSSKDRMLEDDEKATPSPRGWDMLDTLLKSEPLTRDFFSEEENEKEIVKSDFSELAEAKVGAIVAKVFLSSLYDKTVTVSPEALFSDDEKLSIYKPILLDFSSIRKVRLCNKIVDYLKKELEYIVDDHDQMLKLKKQLLVFTGTLDDSAKLVFAQGIADNQLLDGRSLLSILMDIFDMGLIDSLNITEDLKKQISTID